ncbi:MAG TPA: CBS domain-containing protein, partial [Thermomicrobiaceae bacterium]|nr:CBS domain-containing protein [Thermomicrobiaceae bacterium]
MTAVNISDILRYKGSEVVTISPADTVTTLLTTLAERNLGALLVVDGGDVVGIVSERDVVRRLAERGPGVLDGTVEAIMTADVVSC